MTPRPRTTPAAMPPTKTPVFVLVALLGLAAEDVEATEDAAEPAAPTLRTTVLVSVTERVVLWAVVDWKRSSCQYQHKKGLGKRAWEDRR